MQTGDEIGFGPSLNSICTLTSRMSCRLTSGDDALLEHDHGSCAESEVEFCKKGSEVAGSKFRGFAKRGEGFQQLSPKSDRLPLHPFPNGLPSAINSLFGYPGKSHAAGAGQITARWSERSTRLILPLASAQAEAFLRSALPGRTASRHPKLWRRRRLPRVG
jgi:hypothetical protein